MTPSGAALPEVHRSRNVEPVLHHLRLEELAREGDCILLGPFLLRAKFARG
jgi:hypothetical protein